jgi:hypothetical protein
VKAAAPDLIECNGNDWNIRLFGNESQCTAQGQVNAAARDALLREDADQLAFGQRNAGVMQGSDDGAAVCGAVHGDGSCNAQDQTVKETGRARQKDDEADRTTLSTEEE